MERLELHNNFVQMGARGPRLHNKREKNVWGLRPHTFFTLLLCNLVHRIPPDTMFAQVYYFVVSALYLGMDCYKGWAPLYDFKIKSGVSPELFVKSPF